MVRIPVRFGESELMTVQIYLGHETADPNAPCDQVFAVERTVPKSSASARAALDALVRGPTASEEEEAMFTSLPEGVTVKSVTIVNGTAHATFSAELNDVAGSCRVQAIRAQIEETLKQFPTVTDVQISVEGIPDAEVLQP